MSTDIKRRLTKIEANRTDNSIPAVVFVGGEACEFPGETEEEAMSRCGVKPGQKHILVVYVEAPLPVDDPPLKSYPQAERIADEAVDKSEPPVMTIELEPGDDLNTVAAELHISAAELHRQIQSGIVKIIYPETSL